jgi:hypothetical protein
MVLPFVEQKPLYDQFNMNVHYDTAPNTTRKNDSFELMFCPSGTKPYSDSPLNQQIKFTVHYKGVAGAKGPYPPGHPKAVSPQPNCWTGTSAPAGCYAPVIGNQNATHGGAAQSGVLCWRLNVRVRDITDGTSNTLVVGEQAWDPRRIGYGDNGNRDWTQGSTDGNGMAIYAMKNVANPINSQGYNVFTLSPTAWFNEISFGSEHPGGAQFALGDGKITFISENIDMSVYRGLATREGGETAKVP